MGIDGWLGAHFTCPTCRQNVDSSSSTASDDSSAESAADDSAGRWHLRSGGLHGVSRYVFTERPHSHWQNRAASGEVDAEQSLETATEVGDSVPAPPRQMFLGIRHLFSRREMVTTDDDDVQPVEIDLV